ncbi:MAG: replication initiation protein [Leptotrichiaceae bacterium]|nr:replication initiation protein [Leptotrichiaceae bacterium]
MKDIYFSQSIINSVKNDININFSKKITKKERLFLKLIFFKIISNPKSLNKLEIELNEMVSVLELSSIEDFGNFLKKLTEKHILFDISTKSGKYSGIFALISSFILSMNFCQIFFTEEFKYCFSNQKNIFSLLEIEKFIFMEDAFSFNLYSNIIKMSDNRKEFTLPLSSLKVYLNSTDKYKRFFDFEKHVLKKAVFDINTFTDFHIKYKKIKSGTKASNKIVSINFTIRKSKQIPILYDDTIYKMLELVKDRVENPEEIYNLFLLYSVKRGHKYVYDNIDYLKNNSSENFEKKLKKALLLDLAANKLKLYININETVKSPGILHNILMQNINFIKIHYPKIDILQYTAGPLNLKNIRFFKDQDVFEFSNDELELYVKYHSKKKSVIKIYLPDNIIKKIKKARQNNENTHS